ncbi:MAG: hypothetical protein WDZ51_08870 [Pirellulaceae bacterium]
MTATDSNAHGRRHLAAAIVMIAATWLIGLPWLAERPAVRSYLQWLEERKIDPSARYYTDLEAMDPILDKLDRRGRK